MTIENLNNPILIKILGRELSVEEAREVYNQLKDIFGLNNWPYLPPLRDPWNTPLVPPNPWELPKTFPSTPYPTWDPPTYSGWEGTITCCCQNKD